AARPAGALVADRQGRVGVAGHAAGMVELRTDLDPSAAAVEALQRGDAGGAGGNKQHLAAAMDAGAPRLPDYGQRLAQVRHLLTCMHAATGYGQWPTCRR